MRKGTMSLSGKDPDNNQYYLRIFIIKKTQSYDCYSYTVLQN